MKKPLLLWFLVPLMIQVSSVLAAEPARVPWLEDVSFDQVVGLARTAPERPILIDFYAQWCRPCKLLDVMVYNEDEVIDELADVLTFKVDIDKPQYASLKDDFNITVLPTLVWLDERGRELDRFTGYQNKEEFLGLVRTIREGGNTFYRMVDRQALRPEDPGLLFELARRYAERGDDQRAGVLYRRLMGLRFQSDKSVVTDGMMGLAMMEQKAGRPEQARGLARRAAAIYTAEDSTAVAALMAVAELQYSLADTVGVMDTYRTLIAFDETDPVALGAYLRAATETGHDLEQATRYGLRAVVYSDNDPRIMADLARCYDRREQHNKAARWIRKALAEDPENTYYTGLLARYEEEMARRPHRYRGRR